MSFGPQFIKVLQETLTQLVNETARLIETHGGTYADASQAAQELASFTPPELIHTAHYLGTTLLDFAQNTSRLS